MSDLPHCETLRVTHDDGVTTVAFNRPDKRNAMNPLLHTEMHDLMMHLSHHDPHTRVLVLTGEGSCFSAGIDLREFVHDTADDEAERARVTKLWHDWCDRLLRNFQHPTIARIHGYCLGAAMSVVCTCDFALAADDAVFGLPEVNFGHMAAGLFPKIAMGMLPYRDALEIAMTGEPFDAQRAAAMRLINRAVPSAQLTAETHKLARRLADLDPHAVRATKEALHQVADMNNDQAYAWVQAKANELRWRQQRSGEVPAGVEQFLKKVTRPGLGSAGA